MKKTTEDVMQEVNAQIQQKGAAAVTVKDGKLFFFTLNTLEKLILRAKESPDQMVTVLIPNSELNN